MFTNQTVFDTVVAHARKQKCHSMRGTVCQYRDGKGNKCFIGALLPDSLYESNMESIGIVNLIKDIIIAEFFDGVTTTLLVDLQSAHDAFTVDEWESRFAFVAKTHNLLYTPPEA